MVSWDQGCSRPIQEAWFYGSGWCYCLYGSADLLIFFQSDAGHTPKVYYRLSLLVMRKETTKKTSWIAMALIASLTLGLAPFVPEPHIWGKIKWMMGGGIGMTTLDVFDLIFHGLPWLALIVLLFLKFLGPSAIRVKL